MRITEPVPRSERSAGAVNAPTAATPVLGTNSGRAAQLLELQRTCGNASVRRLIQCKLAVSQPGDAFEQEADRMADAAMRVSDPGAAAGRVDREEAPSPEVQRPTVHRVAAGPAAGLGRVAEAPAKEEDDESALMRLQRQAAPAQEGRTLTRAASGEIAEVDGEVEAGIRGLAGGGTPLAPAVRADMESRLGFDFGAVRVHSDTNATHLARSVEALAFAVGSDVVFGRGQYHPESFDGKRLLAHELTHVVQQTGPAEKDRERGGQE